MQIFTEASPFVQEDNRRFRPILRVTADALNEKHAELLPQHVVSGHSVLDIGSCIGATGYWCHQLGATRYLGVEHQQGYASLARELLNPYKGTEILQSTAEDYFRTTSEKFDVVCLFGVVHGVYDPLALIREAAALTTKYFCFDDVGSHPDQAYMQCRTDLRMTMADQQASTIGFGWLIGPAVMDMIMDYLGFKPDSTPVINYRAQNLDQREKYAVPPFRWLGRYIRVREEGKASSYATETESWENFGERANSNSNIPAKPV